VPEEDMRRTFNLGLGLVMIVAKDRVDHLMGYLKSREENAYIVGEVIKA